MERPAELPEIVADLAEMEVVEPLREHVAVAAGLPAVAPVLGQVSPSGAAERGALDDWAVLNVSSMTSESANTRRASQMSASKRNFFLEASMFIALSTNDF